MKSATNVVARPAMGIPSGPSRLRAWKKEIPARGSPTPTQGTATNAPRRRTREEPQNRGKLLCNSLSKERGVLHFPPSVRNYLRFCVGLYISTKEYHVPVEQLLTKLLTEVRAQALHMMVEGSSMRSISRVMGISINTVAKLLKDAREGCSLTEVDSDDPARLSC